ncbi:hypothetical protein PoB_006913000 [Plakobranchus ocellatus]|uniref:Uncharacterized protein n=1 Tax=Plakobranchus ocellatus TaxID=259542 RepID=A0AAV4DEV0_9GAST|nr:hypothetical protein PoB_006913000 [Plakobranchus ocellatus]
MCSDSLQAATLEFESPHQKIRKKPGRLALPWAASISRCWSLNTIEVIQEVSRIFWTVYERGRADLLLFLAWPQQCLKDPQHENPLLLRAGSSRPGRSARSIAHDSPWRRALNEARLETGLVGSDNPLMFSDRRTDTDKTPKTVL